MKRFLNRLRFTRESPEGVAAVEQALASALAETGEGIRSAVD